jgi:leucyl aminopeptidase
MSETDWKAIAARLKELREQEAERVPVLVDKLKAATEEARIANARYVEAHTHFHRISESLRSQVGALEMELRRTAPAELLEFIDRARDLLNSHRHDLTGEQMNTIREIIEKAEALKLDALITDLPKRLSKLEAELPTLSR